VTLPPTDAPGEGEVPKIAAEDLAILKEFVNPVYLEDDASLKVLFFSLQVREKFEEESHVQLFSSFFHPFFSFVFCEVKDAVLPE
jgi:predicted transcriptional regulator